MQKTINLSLDFKIKSYSNVVVQQNDDVLLIIEIYDNGLPVDLTTCTVIMNYISASNNFINISGSSVVKSGNKAIITCPKDCSRAAGNANAQITIVSSDLQESTFPISFKVNKGILNNSEACNNASTILDEIIEVNAKAVDNTIALNNATKTAEDNVKHIQETYPAGSELAETVSLHTTELTINQPSWIPKTLSKLQKGENVTIVVVGDSIVQGLRPIGYLQYNEGWVYKLAEKIASKYSDSTVIASLGMSGNSSNTGEDGSTIVEFKDYTIQSGTNGQIIKVIRSGVGGDTLPRIMARNNTWLTYKGSNPDLVILNEGINDLLKNNEKKYLDSKTYEFYYKTLLDNVKMNKCEIVCNNIHWAGESPDVQFNEFYSRQEIIKKVCNACGVQMIDQNSVWLSHYKEGEGLYGQGTWLENSDYCHPSKDGQEAIANKVFLDLFINNQKLVYTGEENYTILPYNQLNIIQTGFSVNTVKRNDGTLAYTMLISSSDTGATLKTTVNGSTIYLLARKGKDLGICNVSIDGINVCEIDFSFSYPSDISEYKNGAVSHAAYSKHLLAKGLEDKEHTVEITVGPGVRYVPFYGFLVSSLNTKKEDSVVENIGSIKFTLDTSANYMSKAITFDKKHKTVPIVLTNSRNVRINSCATAENSTGCTIFIATLNGSNFSEGELTVNYISKDR